MRKIKFRAWDKDTGSWIYSDHTKGSMAWFWDMMEEYNCEIMQFTGLTDKNDVEIYEGDLIENIFMPDDNDNEALPIEYMGYEFVAVRKRENGITYVLDNDYERFWESKIIGNIYDNKELLGGTPKAPENSHFEGTKNDSSM